MIGGLVAKLPRREYAGHARHHLIDVDDAEAEVERGDAAALFPTTSAVPIIPNTM
jgi:hypothetical protein